MSQREINELCEQLNDFDAHVRRAALDALHSIVMAGDLPLPAPKPEVNLHYHTFYSFNANHWSPSRIAWEAALHGLEIAGVVDFDVLDGMDEFLHAGDLLRLRTVVGVESRVFVSEYSDKVLNSPNEPGVAYFMGCGCFRLPPRESKAEATFKQLFDIARTRTHEMMGRLNDHMPDIGLDYERNVLALTPGGNATERHLLLAYDRKARAAFKREEERIDFWAQALGVPVDDVRAQESNAPAFHELIRAKLMKFGGVGYAPPDQGSFPTVEAMIEMARGMEALPAYAYLDGSTDGEEDIEALLDLMVSKGVVALNIIPDRNWNFKDDAVKKTKTGHLRRTVAAARERDLPLNIGTEMNKAGLPFVDNFGAPELAEHAEAFLHGARVLHGHSLLARYAELGYWSEGIRAAFGEDRKARNDYFAQAGACQVPLRALRDHLVDRAGELDPQDVLRLLQEQ